jgi:hypothetical protein
MCNGRGGGGVIRAVQVHPARRREGVFKAWLRGLQQQFGVVVIEYVGAMGLLEKLGECNFREALERADWEDNPTLYWSRSI